MKNRILYLTAERIIEYNILSLTLIKVKKADKPEVLSFQKITDIINECKESKGDIYDKAIIILKGLIQKHPFASGNRRTAFIATKYFLLNNKAKFKIKDYPKHAKAMLGIREDYYTTKEIKEWIKNGTIKEFER